jgi:thiol:disulfide interchange protein DsbD
MTGIKRVPGFLLVFLFSSFICSAQIQNPLVWKFSAKPINDSQYVIVLHGDIQQGWHIYGLHSDSNGPIPMALEFAPSPGYALKGAAGETNSINSYDSVFKVKVEYFVKVAEITQPIVIRSSVATTVKGNVIYQSCAEGMCLPPKTVPFSVTIPGVPKKESSGYFTIFLLGLAAGIGSLLTPCVFPMIPLTVSFFLKRQSKRRKSIMDASVYSFSIVLIYVLLGVIITALFGQNGLNAIASNGWTNLIFFLIFVIFGASFLGAFEIALPSTWATKFDSASERGGVMGIFFMALTLCVVSFSCTGPFLGSLLPASSQGSYWSLVVGFFGFSLALSIPFALFSVFPTWLGSLPKSGGWLNSVKVVFGLLELAFALKFLSTTDLVGLHIKWLHFHINGPMGILHREIFLAIWVIIFTIMGFYLMGKIKFHHDSDIKYVSVFRLIIAILAFSFALYLVPGLFGAPLKIISGFPPPSQYSEGWKREGSGSIIKSDNTAKDAPQLPRGVSAIKHQTLGCPLDLDCFHDYYEAIANAALQKKPVLIDFTGNSCTNCRRMEENVWSDPRVMADIANDFILVSLYVDDQTPLPDSLKTKSQISGDPIETYGDKWSEFESVKYQRNSQPYYVLVDAAGNILTEPKGYTPDIEEYLNFLEEAKKAFNKSVTN